ncbi:MAG: VOC family protein [Ferruginibacter sp.]
MTENNWPCNLRFHHTGCITRDIEASKKIYSGILGFKNISDSIYISAQNVKVCFVETAPGCFVEFVEPTVENSFFEKLLKSKNPFYHIGLLADDFDASIAALTENGFYLLNTFESEAFQGRRCSFLYSNEMQLIELIEMPA